ncbi:MAG: (Fe-S)-binding protein [Anaerolineae bacterium]
MRSYKWRLSRSWAQCKTAIRRRKGILWGFILIFDRHWGIVEERTRLIKEYSLEVTSPPCDPGAERWNAIAHLSGDIGEVLPYLNAAALKGCIYDHQSRILTWQRGGRRVIIRPQDIAVTNLEDREDAWRVVESLVKTINQTWDRRADIEPDYRKRERLKPMDIYKLLPGTNCKACGEPSCFAFALKVTVGEVKIENCQPLFADEYRNEREELQALLEAASLP